MHLSVMSPEELKKAYETDLKEAFPPAELKPLKAMEAMRRRGRPLATSCCGSTRTGGTS